MLRKEFERTTPESVGIDSKAVERLVESLDSGYTEPHGLMIMRFGKVCAEGWWSPYAPGIRHSLQSHTKTYASTAVGIACTEHLLNLDDRIIDIFKDEAPENPSENLKKLTVHDVLCMGCGMDEMPKPSKNWIRDFLATPVNHEPGKTFMYNSTGSNLLGAIITKITGLSLQNYLKTKLFDKIGIDAENLRWIYMPDGIEVGGGGLYSTTEDNLRLLKLYADGGVWEGERILAEDFVKKATTKENDTSSEQKALPEMPDHFCGYGYQMWMCKPKNVYRADGALGQFTVVSPEKNLLVSITQNADGAAVTQKSLDDIWEFMETVTADKLPEDSKASKHLANRMSRLALPNPVYAPSSKIVPEIDGKTFTVTDGKLVWDSAFPSFMSGRKSTPGIEKFSFTFKNDVCLFNYLQGNENKSFEIAVDGSRKYNCIPIENTPVSRTLICGAWIEENVFKMSIRWIEAYYENKYAFKFNGDNVTIQCSIGAMAGKNFDIVKAVAL